MRAIVVERLERAFDEVREVCGVDLAGDQGEIYAFLGPKGFVGSITWSETWPGFVAVAGMLAVVAALSLRGMRRTAV